jgi:hypothetical protein
MVENPSSQPGEGEVESGVAGEMRLQSDHLVCAAFAPGILPHLRNINSLPGILVRTVSGNPLLVSITIRDLTCLLILQL